MDARQRDLGPIRESAGPSLRMLLLGLVPCMIALVPTAQVALEAPTLQRWAVVMGLGLAALFWLTWIGTSRLSIHEFGFKLSSLYGSKVLLYEEIEEFSAPYHADHPGMAIYSFWFRGGGTTIHFGWRFAKALDFGWYLADAVREIVLGHLLAKLERGEVVRFSFGWIDVVRISKSEGLRTWRFLPHTFALADIQRCRLDGTRLHVELRAGEVHTFLMGSQGNYGTWNWFVLGDLLERVFAEQVTASDASSPPRGA